MRRSDRRASQGASRNRPLDANPWRPAMIGDRSRSPSPTHPNISLLIVADVRLYREGLSGSLGRREHLTVVGEAGSREAALPLIASHPPNVVVLDMATRDSLAIVRAISSAAPSVKI